LQTSPGFRPFIAPFEQGEIGPDMFRAACNMGLEGLVSKHRDRAYGAGRCKHWIKVKNPRARNRATSNRLFSAGSESEHAGR
jgi:ATP-dependent DNA ligase